jgi:LacI family transcriptional regulator
MEKRQRKRLQGNTAPVTIVDVASAAGVSVATVSRALNTPEKVREAVRERVQAAAKVLDYVPHHAARALASRRSNTIGAIIPTIDNAIFARGCQALQQHLHMLGFTLLLASSEYDPERELDELHALLEHGVDGIMLVGEDHDPRLYNLLEAKRIPFVNTWTYHTANRHPCIGFNNRETMARLVNYLLDLGHTRFAMIAGVVDHNDRAAERVQGVRDALAKHGLSLSPDQLIERPYSIADGRDALRMLMSQTHQPTAIICGNDILAYGAILESQAMKIDVPGKLSITGFDDLELSSHIQPSLTTVRVPSIDMGVKAADYLTARIAGRPAPNLVELGAELIIRATTARPHP